MFMFELTRQALEDHPFTEPWQAIIFLLMFVVVMGFFIWGVVIPAVKDLINWIKRKINKK